MSYHEVCERLCPDYLAMGMSWDDYWHGDPSMTIYYRKANELKNQHSNFEMWLQGLYFYHALCDVAPALHAFSKNPKPQKYLDEPLALTEKEQADKKKRQEKAEFEQTKADVRAWMQRANRMISEKASKGENNG